MSSRSDKLAVAFFLLSGLFLAMLVGALFAKFRWAPYPWLSDSVDSLGQSLRGRRPHHLGLIAYDWSGVRVHDREAMGEGLTLLTSYWQDLDWKAGIKLIDHDGQVLHTWPVDVAEIWPESPHDDYVTRTGAEVFDYVHGSWLFDNGDVIFNVENMGLVRMDAAGEVLWTLPIRTHHSVSRAENGDFWVSALEWSDTDEESDRRVRRRFPGLTTPLSEDLVLRVTPDGEVVARINVLQLLFRSGYGRLLWKLSRRRSDDVTHLNDIEELSSEMAAQYPLFEAGDLVISLKFVHAVLVMRPSTGKVLWLATDPFMEQHDPDFIGDGWIAVFDNNTDYSPRGQFLGGSRIVAVKPGTDETEVLYPRGDDAAPFYTPFGGKMQFLPGGNILIVEARAGRVFEVNAEGETLWEWVQLPYDEHAVPEVLEATRYPITPQQVAAWSSPL